MTVPDRLATALADRYRILRLLGTGGMATVYLAEDLKHQRQVALKVLKPELGAVLGAERFVNEIRTTANLQHPNLLPLFDSGEADGSLFYVMPYIEGETLRERLRADPQLSVDETVRIVSLLAGALDFAHARGVVHRDLKPENILLQAGQPIIADFGISLAVQQAGGARVTETGLSLGTPSYMSPEQAAGTHAVDARTDQYALAATAYEMLTGEPPHTGPTTPAVIARLMTERPRDIRATRPAVPVGVDAAIQRALEKSPADRYASCGAFAAALADGARAVSPAPAERQPASGSASVTTRSRRLVPFGALALLGIAAVAGVMLTQRAGGSADAAEQSLAVLPFTSVGGDTSNSYFAAGIADELTSALMQIPGLRLAGRSSSARVKQEGRDARAIGEALNVGAVLDGSVRRSGDRIRVSAELTRASDERVIWSQTYERALADVFAVQDEITREIVGALQVRLASALGSGNTAARGGTSNLEAYDLYLRARPLYLARGGGLLQAERYLLDATTRDPNYARAQAMLASVVLVQPYYVKTPVLNANARGRAAALRAIALDDSLAEAHMALGHAHSEAGEWEAARQAYARALALDPRSADANYRMGELLYRTGRPRDAIMYFAEANRLDPFYSNNSAYLALARAMVGQFDEALTLARQTITLDPEQISINAWYTDVLELAGRPEEAAAQARRLLGLSDATLARSGVAAGVLARTGNREEARAILRRIEATPVGTPEREVARAFAYLGLGELDAALRHLEVAARIDAKRVAAFGLVGLQFDSVRQDPRFAAVLRELDLDVERLTLPDGGRSR